MEQNRTEQNRAEHNTIHVGNTRHANSFSNCILRRMLEATA